MRQKKILIVWDRAGDYHRARVKALAGVIGKENTFLADLGASDSLYKWDTSSQTDYSFFVLSDKPAGKINLINRFAKLRAIIKKNHITDICLSGYGKAEYIIFMMYARFIGLKVLIFAESWYNQNKLFDTMKGAFLRCFCNVVFVSGQRAFIHFTKRLDISPRKIDIGYSVVDNNHFRYIFENFHTEEKIPIILCVARFSPEKNLEMLIYAFLESTIKDSYKLRITGGGYLKDQLKKAAGNYSNIELMDWVGYEKLPALYHQAKWFVLPGIFEPWGLVVNEAMAAGLPVIVSQQSGCVPELVSRANGFIFDAKNKQELISIFNNIETIQEKELMKMKQVSMEIINNFTPKIWADKLIKLLSS